MDSQAVMNLKLRILRQINDAIQEVPDGLSVTINGQRFARINICCGGHRLKPLMGCALPPFHEGQCFSVEQGEFFEAEFGTATEPWKEMLLEGSA